MPLFLGSPRVFLSASPFYAYDIIDLFSDGIGPIDDVVSTLGSVIETPPGFFDYSDIPARAYV